MTARVEWHERLDSTQERAHQLAALGAPPGAAVAAVVQSRGRGTRGRAWQAGRGGLWLSVVVRPRDAGAIELLSLRVGLTVAARLEPAAGLPIGAVQVKWPNDLVARDRKLGGILCEARWHGEHPAWVVVGVGLNVRNRLAPPLDRTSTRLADLGFAGEPEGLAPVVVEAVLAAAARPGPLAPEELAAFAERDWLHGRRLERPVPGRVAGISPGGRLRLETDQGTVRELMEAVTWTDLAPSGGTR